MKPFFSYFGAKARIAKKYPEPKHNTIIEPFAGSASYSNQYPDKQVILYDSNPIIVGVWEYLIGSKESEILKLPTNFNHIDDIKVPQEAKWLIGYWLAMGCARPSLKPSLFSYWNDKIKNRIVTQQRNIRHWKIFQKRYSEISENPKATWFIDPPYKTEGLIYQSHGSKHIDYKDLAKWSKTRQGQIIVCEANNADWLPFKPFQEIVGVSHKKCKELIYYKENTK